jgi:peptidoglycan-associated lipoprotein
MFAMAAVAVVGCAKRPVLLVAGAPAPTGFATVVPGSSQAVVVTQERTVVTQQPSAAAQSQSQGASRQAATAPGGDAASQPAASPKSAVAQTTPRPEQRDFGPTAPIGPIHFDFDKSDIRPDAARTLEANAKWFRANPNYLILIEGHCDERGTNEYNVALGERRARSTMNYLVAQGIASSRMTIVSYGEERPTCGQHNEACWAKNRRAALLVKETVPSALPGAVISPSSGASRQPTSRVASRASVTEPVSSPSRSGTPTPPAPQRRQQVP